MESSAPFSKHHFVNTCMSSSSFFLLLLVILATKDLQVLGLQPIPETIDFHMKVAEFSCYFRVPK